MTLLRFAFVALFALAAACSPKPESSEALALEVIEENFRTTDLSALIEVTSFVMHSSMRKLGLAGWFIILLIWQKM